MQLIIPIIKPGQTGPDVANLQDTLLALLENQIIQAKKLPVSQEEFKDLIKALNTEREQSYFNNATQFFVLHFQKQLLSDVLEGVVEEKTASLLNSYLKDLGLLEKSLIPKSEPDAAQFTVTGKVFSRVRVGVGVLPVQIFDKNVGGDELVAEVTTDAQGIYHATFTVPNVNSGVKQFPDLQARVVLKEKLLGVSEIRYNASSNENLTVILNDQSADALPSEYETLKLALSTHVKGTLAGLKEDENQQDITYLANKTGWDARAIALAALAEQFSNRTKTKKHHIEPEFFYALFRAGLPANENALYQTDANNAEAIWNQAIDKGVISSQYKKNQLSDIRDNFQNLSKEGILDSPALIGLSPLKDMLSVSLSALFPGVEPKQAQITELANLYIQHRTDPDALWRAVGSDFGELAEIQLRLDGQLSYLTFNNAPLMSKLNERLSNLTANDTKLINALHGTKVKQDKGTRTIDLVVMGFHNADKWKEIIDDGSLPPGITDKDTYAEIMAAQIRLSYPTAVVAMTIKDALIIKDKPIKMQEDAISKGTSNFLIKHQDKFNDASNFLLKHHSTFELGMQPIEQYIPQIKPEEREGVTKDIIDTIKQVQRAHQIAPSHTAMTGLLKNGIDSAYSVTQYERDEFISTFTEELGGKANAILTYAKSQQVHNAVVNIATSYLIAKNAPPIGVHSPAKIVSPAPNLPEDTSGVIAYPTLEALFGEMDYCACEHCRSILSPAAYLVSLLQFIDLNRYDKDGVELPKSYQGENPLDVLLKRRPDIQHLPLTCENTNTPLPYIDLVNETLEYFISNDLSLSSPIEYIGYNTDSKATAEELLASPQFSDTQTSIKAYGDLASAYFPATLPFHQSLEYLRRYFDKFETPLPMIMEVLRESNSLDRQDKTDPAKPIVYKYGWRDIMMEELRLSRTEHKILTNYDLDLPNKEKLTLQQLYGFPTELYGHPPNIDIKEADKLMLGYFLFNIGLEFIQDLDNDKGELSKSLRQQFINQGKALSDNCFVEVKKKQSNWTLVDTFTYDIRNEKNTLNVYLIGLSNAKFFTRRMGISYEELGEILHTRFINPNSTLIPKLERLYLPFSTLKKFKDDDDIDDAGFDKLLPKGLDADQYGGDIKAWVKDEMNYAKIMSLIILTNPAKTEDICSFDKLEFRYSDPGKIDQPIRTIEFYRLLRFIRLWKKLGWTIEQTDKTITALCPIDQTPDGVDDTVNLQRLDEIFLALLPRLGAIKRVMGALNLNPQKDLLQLLACFAPIDTHGVASLYRQMFLSPALLKQDPAFADDGYGSYLMDDKEKLLTHTETLRAAFQITDDEFSLITSELKQPFNVETNLTVENISEVFKRSWLARKLKLSVREFLLITKYTGIDPFAMPEHNPDQGEPNLPILRLIELVESLRTASMKPEQALYLIWNQDISGKSTPDNSEVLEFARNLRASFAAIESEFVVVDDPDGQITRARMALVYDNETTDRFFGLLEEKTVTDVKYSFENVTIDVQEAIFNAGRNGYNLKIYSVTTVNELTNIDPNLVIVALVGTELHIRIFDANKNIVVDKKEKELVSGDVLVALKKRLNPLPSEDTLSKEEKQKIIKDAALVVGYTLQSKIAYNNLRKRLSYSGGAMPVEIKDALLAIQGLPQPDEFQFAIIELYTNSRVLLDRFDELSKLYEAYLKSNETLEKSSTLLTGLLNTLKPIRKYQQALQAITAISKTDIGFASALLDSKLEEGKYLLHMVNDDNQPALNDLILIETHGLSAEFFFSDKVNDVVDKVSDAELNLNYSAKQEGKAKLPSNIFNVDKPISGIWSGYLDILEKGFYNFHIETDMGASVVLTLDGIPIDLTLNGNIHSNKDAIELRAGTLYSIYLKVEKVKDRLTVRWETEGRGKEVIPPRFLYSKFLIDNLRATYIRFLKIVSLVEVLKLTANEIVYFASHTDYRIDEQVWLNAMPVTDKPDDTIPPELFKAFKALLNFARIKAEISPGDERLLTVLKNPETRVNDIGSAPDKPEYLLLSLTRWDANSLDTLLTRFGKLKDDKVDRNALKKFETFYRVHSAYSVMKKLGISATALINATTNEPSATTVRDLQSALRARYVESDWLNVLKPINDEMRALQRDALVAYILHQFRVNPEKAHIDTPDKLFEFFLTDVQMSPCMQTSRIRHALSSVQLFIERCFMNLEKEVMPSTIKDKQKQWEWMRRYRVWEANRKVFLWPENWLEPELRDDQSPIFKETISELLQSDINEDSAAVALLNYLSKLDEVAKLEPCGIHYVENDLGDASDDIAHVVARTSGANRKYFYRRREGVSWTPWEQIKLDITDNPVAPVVWKGRLFIFWLKILKQVPGSVPDLSKDYDLTKINPAKLVPASSQKITVQAVLSWSEYYNGKWQATKTSDINKPTIIDEFDATGKYEFNCSNLQFEFRRTETEDTLLIFLHHLDRGTRTTQWFRLHNTHSLPIRREDHVEIESTWDLLSGQEAGNSFVINSGTVRISYWELSNRSVLDREVMTMKGVFNYKVVQPLHNLKSPWDSPFLYEDSHHVFYVTTTKKPITVGEWQSGFDVIPIPPEKQNTIPPLNVEPKQTLPNTLNTVIPKVNNGLGDPFPTDHFVSGRDDFINVGISTTNTVHYGETEIGIAGSNYLLLKR
jgi:Neuraminidase-like domain/Salmonella virulence plasmid 28.1kDa A protein